MESGNKACAIHNTRRMELECTTMIVENENKVFGMYKKKRVEHGCAVMTVKSENKSLECIKIVEWNLDPNNNY